MDPRQCVGKWGTWLLGCMAGSITIPPILWYITRTPSARCGAPRTVPIRHPPYMWSKAIKVSLFRVVRPESQCVPQRITRN